GLAADPHPHPSPLPSRERGPEHLSLYGRGRRSRVRVSGTLVLSFLIVIDDNCFVESKASVVGTAKGFVMLSRTLLALSLLSSAPVAQAAAQVGDRVDNFRLLDHEGRSHELYYLSDMKAVVLMTHQSGCKDSAASIAALNSISQQYTPQGVTVLMLDSKLA